MKVTESLDEVYSRYGKEIYEANGIEVSPKKGSVVYLGKHNYNHAINYAMSLGLFVPTYDEMKELVKHFKRSNDYCSLNVYGTSTTSQYDVQCQVTFPKQKYPITKDIPLDVYGITEMTRADIQLGNFEIYYSVEGWKESNGIEQPKEEQTFQGIREYDEKLLKDLKKWLSEETPMPLPLSYISRFIKTRYSNKELEELFRKKQEAQKIVDECEKRIQALKV